MKCFLSLLQLSLLLLLCQTGAIDAAVQEVSSLRASKTTVEPTLETAVFNKINRYRVNHSLRPLDWSAVVAREARRHSVNMVNGTVPFGHEGADQRFDSLKLAFPTLTRYGENVAFNQGYKNPAAQAVKGWINSPGHLANIVGDYNLTGVGVARNTKGQYYFTQIFIKVASRALSPVNDDQNYEVVKIEWTSEAPIQ